MLIPEEYMKKIIAGISFALASMGAYAQTQTPIWNLYQVNADEGHVAGYIFHTESIGTRYTATPTKAGTSLRLICSLAGVWDPMIAVVWDGVEMSSKDLSVKIVIDGKTNDTIQEYHWTQESKMTYRLLKDSPELLDAMKKGHRISLTWFDSDAVKRTTIFSLITFNAYLGDFNTACHINNK